MKFRQKINLILPVRLRPVILFLSLAGCLFLLPTRTHSQVSADSSESLPDDLDKTKEDIENQGYSYRQKGMRALGDNIHSAAISFFEKYRRLTQGDEPDFTDATILLIRAHLGNGDAEAAHRILKDYDEKSKGAEEGYYRRNLIYWRAAVLIRNNDIEKGLATLEPLLEEEEYPELRERAVLLRGSALAKNSRWEKAHEVLLDFLENFPDSQFRGQAILDMSKVAIADQNYEETEELLRRAKEETEIEPSSIELHRLLLETSRGNIEKALEIFGSLSEDAPLVSDPEWQLVFSQFARKLTTLEQWEEAIPVINKAYQLAAENDEKAEILMLRVKAETELDRKEAAIRSLSSLIDSFPEYQGADEALLRRATLKAELGEYEEAIADTLKVYNDTTLNPELRFRAGIESGRLAIKMEEYTKAIFYLTRAGDIEKIEPEPQARALIEAGNAAMKAEDYSQAVTIYKKVTENMPNTAAAADALLQLGEALIKKGQPEEAATVLEQFIAQYPDDNRVAQSRLNKASALRQAGNPEESINAFEEFVDNHPEHEKAADALMQVYRIAREHGDPDKCMQTLNRICTEYAETQLHTAALYHRIYIAFQVGDYDLAVTESERFVDDFENLPLSADVLLWLGDHYANQNNFERAEHSYRKVALLFPEKSRAYQGLYEAASAAMKQEDGQERALRLLDEFPENLSQNNEIEPAIFGRAAFLRGDILAERQEFEKAIDWFAKARENLAEEAPELSLAAKGRMADMYFSLDTEEGYQKATEIYKELIYADNLSPQLRDNAHYRLAKTLQKRDNRQKALEHYLEIIFSYELETRDGQARDWYYFARASYDAAQILIEKNKPDAAARIYERIEQSGIPTAAEAGRRAREIRQAHKLDE